MISNAGNVPGVIEKSVAALQQFHAGVTSGVHTMLGAGERQETHLIHDAEINCFIPLRCLSQCCHWGVSQSQVGIFWWTKAEIFIGCVGMRAMMMPASIYVIQELSSSFLLYFLLKSFMWTFCCGLVSITWLISHWVLACTSSWPVLRYGIYNFLFKSFHWILPPSEVIC